MLEKVLERLGTTESTTLAVKREAGGKIRVTSLLWSEPKAILKGEVLEIRNVDGSLHIAREVKYRTNGVSLPSGKRDFAGQRQRRRKGPSHSIDRQKVPARKPTNSALFARHRKNSVCMRLRGGARRTRTSDQAVIAKRWAKQGAVIANFDHPSQKRRSPQYLSVKLSGGCSGDQLSIGRSGRICDCLFETLKSLRFSNAGFDFVYSPCVLVSRRLQPLRTATWDRTERCRTDPRRAVPCGSFTIFSTARGSVPGARRWHPMSPS
jgi:hypothetical protein